MATETNNYFIEIHQAKRIAQILKEIRQIILDMPAPVDMKDSLLKSLAELNQILETSEVKDVG